MGTVGYMSPEQVRGQSGRPRSDIFAFGAILYEMISGKRAFHGETAADTMSAILKEETPELSETARNVPPGLERIVRHCLEKNPSQRFHSAGDLAFDLEALTEISATSKSGAQAAVEEVQRAEIASQTGECSCCNRARGGPARRWAGGWDEAAAPRLHPNTSRSPSAPAQSAMPASLPTAALCTTRPGKVVAHQLYLARTDDNGSRELGLKDAALLSISKSGELAIRLNTIYRGGYAQNRNARPGSAQRRHAPRSPRECAGRRLGRGRRKDGGGPLRPGDQPLAAGVSRGQGVV